MSEEKSVAQEYQEMYDKAVKITESELSKYPLNKNESKHKRFKDHLIDMMIMYDAKHGITTASEDKFAELQEKSKNDRV